MHWRWRVRYTYNEEGSEGTEKRPRETVERRMGGSGGWKATAYPTFK